VLAAPDAPAQLVQLRDPVALGVLDEHHRRVGDVDADLDHGGGDEHVGGARREGRHRLLLLARALLPVQEHDAEVAQLGRPEALELGGGGARLQCLGLLDERADDERLAARAQLLADALVSALALALGGGHERVDRPPARRQLAQHGHVEVAVGGQRERARDRRGGHVQHVRGQRRRRLAVERAALVDAEAVLLVDHDDREAVELDGGLDQRVRADEQPQLAGGELAEQVGAARRGRRAGQQRRLHQLARHQLLQRREVLLGERLRRRHQRGLRAALDRAQHRVERDDGLARADLPHQQPLHRAVAGEVGVDGLHRAPLVVGRRERQRVGEPPPRQLARRLERLGARALAAAGAAAQERDLEQHQLLEGQPAATALVVAEVGGVERRGAVGQPLERAQPRRQRLYRLLRRPAPLASEGEDLGRREPVGRRVGRHLPRRAHRLAGRRVE
jgi:hypothetical protein